MSRAHGIIGFVFAIVFLATGQYMRHFFPEAHLDDIGARMMFRSAHVYIALSSLLNLLLGVYLRRFPDGRRKSAQIVGSACIMLTRGIFTVAFFVEPARHRLDRPVALAGLVLAFAGTLLHVMAGRGRKRAGR